MTLVYELKIKEEIYKCMFPSINKFTKKPFDICAIRFDNKGKPIFSGQNEIIFEDSSIVFNDKKEMGYLQEIDVNSLPDLYKNQIDLLIKSENQYYKFYKLINENNQ